ncbi:MAG: hypothetical protein ACI9SY_000721 [Candidatus Paceibacteria bacterium]|jgi:hypothetical protein
MDDKNLTTGDDIEFKNWETLQVFVTGQISALTTKTLGSLQATDWEGHERYSSEEAMYAEYKKYYGNAVGPDTEVKIINFTFKSI